MIFTQTWLARIPAEDLAGCEVVWTEPAIEWPAAGPDWVREQLGDRRFLADWLSLIPHPFKCPPVDSFQPA